MFPVSQEGRCLSWRGRGEGLEGQLETESGNGKWKQKVETESGNGKGSPSSLTVHQIMATKIAYCAGGDPTGF